MKITINDLDSSVAKMVEYTFYEWHTDENDDDHTDTYGTLVVEFRSGRVYEYDKVRVATFTKLVEAKSFGVYLNAEIKPYHEVRELTNA